MHFFCLYFDGLWCINKDLLSLNQSEDLKPIGTLINLFILISSVSYLFSLLISLIYLPLLSLLCCASYGELVSPTGFHQATDLRPV